MPLAYAELIPLYKEIAEKGVIELEWKAKRRRPNISIDATISQISEAANDAGAANTSTVAKQFEFDDDMGADDGNADGSFAAKRMLTPGAMKPRAKPGK